MTIRVVLADDHPVVPQGLAAMLRSVEGIDVVGEASNGREAVRAAVTLSPDVIILDIHMPELDGVAAAREIRRTAPQVGVLVLTMLDDDDSVRSALHAGAAGYVSRATRNRRSCARSSPSHPAMPSSPPASPDTSSISVNRPPTATRRSSPGSLPVSTASSNCWRPA